jgi:bifunctional DNA-binding transcriptional regulator/antitoxin component of YhaV-PrlF toxin-antitoxin module
MAKPRSTTGKPAGKPADIPQPHKARTHTPPAPKPLAERLQIKPGMDVLIARAPFDVIPLLGPLPDGARARSLKTLSSRSRADCVLLFVEDQAAIEAHAPRAIAAVRPGGMLWIAYPKQTGAIATDINRDRGWDVVSAAGWEGVRQVAIDETWSGLRFRPLAEIGQPTRRSG